MKGCGVRSFGRKWAGTGVLFLVLALAPCVHAERTHLKPGMKVTKERSSLRVAGEPGLSTMLSNDSPLGGRETDWLVTVLCPEGLVYVVFVAPEQDFGAYRQTFQAMLDSIRFTAQ